ncbi:MAG: hypothetical protein IJM63_09655 [Solobacterium sp.]|nr:hypothetical protein [Solobacterium sp.]MBQ9824749.1 hypothetical protein [Solobacterium sp.]
MAKGTKKRKIRRSVALLNLSVSMLILSSFLYLCSALFLRSYNNSLSTQAQEISRQIAVLELQNDAVSVEIAKLASADRVDEIAANNGLSRNSSNVISITNGENGD